MCDTDMMNICLQATGSHFTKTVVTHGRPDAFLLASTGAVSQASAPEAVRPPNAPYLTTLIPPGRVFKQQGQK